MPQLLLSGLKLMLVGMAIVYLFLALLVGVIGIAARLLDRSAGDSGPALASPTTDQALEEAELAAAIAAAIHHHQGR
ncbi:OadG family transporter subunit [Candidatus Methylocalor cossyra]|uniref:OadG family transporter subunit n=1 Tax=Candidatus Methylocalor cossyra TaxID=3108543 RepID=UPI0032B16812